MENRTNDTRKKLEAALELLTQETTTFDKFEKIKILIRGINPRLDQKLDSASGAIKKLRQIQKGEIIELTIGAFPEDTEEKKKRKKALLFFITSWKDLKSEVARVKGIYNEASADNKISGQEQATMAGKILGVMKGPLGIITLGAVGIVALSQFITSSSVKININNKGCLALTPIAKLPVQIPGIKLPEETIPDGGTGVAQVPPLTISVDGTKDGSITLSTMGFSMGYYLPSGSSDLVFDGESLVGKETTVNLGDSKEHTLDVVCRK